MRLHFWTAHIPALLLPALLGKDALGPAYRRRLADSLYARVRAPVEGCGAVAIVALVCLLRAGGWVFGAVMVASLLIMAARIMQTRRYFRAARAAGTQYGTPDGWARHYVMSALITTTMWPVLDVSALHAGGSMLQIFVITVQSGWLGAACTRNAASPAASFWQAFLVLGPAIICAALSADHFLYVLIPFAAIQFSASLGISHSLASQMMAAMQSEQLLERANARLTELSATDGLTGIANRRAFDAALQAEWGRAARDSTDLALLVIDVDFFKGFNDSYGHPAGDDCLRLIADVTARTLRRPPDTAARFGGEEFVALLPGTNALAAIEVAERLRLAIMAADVTHAGSKFGIVTVSIGAASIAPHPGTQAQALIDLADRALYEAKGAGRNMVRCAGQSLDLGAWSAPAPVSR